MERLSPKRKNPRVAALSSYFIGYRLPSLSHLQMMYVHTSAAIEDKKINIWWSIYHLKGRTPELPPEVLPFVIRLLKIT
jgi:hypothetical protein